MRGGYTERQVGGTDARDGAFAVVDGTVTRSADGVADSVSHVTGLYSNSALAACCDASERSPAAPPMRPQVKRGSRVAGALWPRSVHAVAAVSVAVSRSRSVMPRTTSRCRARATSC